MPWTPILKTTSGTQELLPRELTKAKGVYKMDARGVFLDKRPPIKCDLAVLVTLAGFLSNPEINPGVFFYRFYLSSAQTRCPVNGMKIKEKEPR